jgi:hypothetical protein
MFALSIVFTICTNSKDCWVIAETGHSESETVAIVQ